MVLLDEGLSELANQFKDLIDEGRWGTGTTTPSASDTGLETPVAASLKTVTTSTSGNAAQFNHQLSSTDANSNDFTEYELQFVNNDSLIRVLHGAINKTNSFDMTTITTINFIRS